MTEEIQKDPRNSQALLIWDRLLDTFDKCSVQFGVSWMQVVNQFTSGRWILTVAAACIMVYVCCKDITYVKEFKEIIAVIIYAYFQRGDRGQETKTTETKTISEVKTP